MAEKFFDPNQLHTIFQQMSGKGVAQGMGRNLFRNSGFFHAIVKSEGNSGSGKVSNIPKAWKKSTFRTVGPILHPVCTQSIQRGLR